LTSDKGKDFSFLGPSWPALGPTEPPIQMVTGCSFLGGKAARAWNGPLTST